MTTSGSLSTQTPAYAADVGRRDAARGGVVAIAALCSVQFVDVLGVTVVVTALPNPAVMLSWPPVDHPLRPHLHHRALPLPHLGLGLL
jgi:hypothetical protein